MLAAAHPRVGGQTDPALIGWQRFGRFRLPQENRSYKFAHLQCIGESASLREERPRGANLVIKYGTMLETAHEDAERDDEHLVEQHRETDSPRRGVKATNTLAHGVR